MNSYWLVICVFVIGFGWGAAAMLIFFWKKAEDILGSCRRAAGELQESCRRAAGELQESCRRAAGELQESCRRVIKLQKELLESEDNVQKKMFEYADLVKKSFDISCKHTDHVVEGLNKLIEAVRGEEADDA